MRLVGSVHKYIHARPRNRKNPIESVTNVSRTLDPWAGIAAHAMQGKRNQHADGGGNHQIQDDGRHHHDAQSQVARRTEPAVIPARLPHMSPFNRLDYHLLAQQVAARVVRQLLERKSANHERDSLVAGVAPDARHDRHQRRERHEILNGGFE